MWTFLACQTDGTPVCGLRDARNRKITFSLSDAPSMTWDTDGDSSSAMAITELDHDVIAYRDGTAMFRGRIGATQDTLDVNGHSVAWTATGYEAILERRITWPTSTLSWTGTDQALIVKAMIDATQTLTDGDLDIDTSGITATGRTRDYTRDPGKTIKSSIDDLASMIDGFDFSIEPDMTAHVWYPERGSAVSWAAVWGRTVSALTRTTDPSSFASDLLGIGGDGTTPHTSSRTPRTLGRWESTESWSDVTVQSTLDAHTDGQLVLDDWIPAYSATITPDRWTPDDAWLGDTIGVHVHSGRLNVDTTARIVGVTITIGDDDTEQVDLDLARVVPNLKNRLGALAGRVGNLERR